MERLFTAANLYFALLERFGPAFWLRRKWAWLLVASTVALSWGFWQFILEAKSSRLTLNWTLLYLIVPELFFLRALDRLRDTKRAEALSRINRKYKQNFSSLVEGRRYLLARFFGRKEDEYLDFAAEVDKVLAYRDELRVPLPTRFSDFARLLYDPESKQRIYALLIVLASALTALSIHEGAGISNLFDLFGTGSTALLVAWIVVTIYLAFVLAFLLAARIGLIAFIAYLTVLVDGKAARDPMTLRYLQRDLLLFHRFVHLRAAIEG